MAQVRSVRGYGKGITQAAALASALGEALEQYAARHVPRSALLRAPFSEVVSQAFDPRWLCLYSSRQYRNPGFPFTPFDAGRPMLWTPGRWLDTQEAVLLPAAATYLSCALEREDALSQTTSNGLAAGVNLHDAASRAALELYERGEFLRAWLTREPGTVVNVDSLGPEYALLVEAMQSRAALTEIYLISSDPFVAVCMARGDGRKWPGTTLGLGAGWSARDAAHKAILEHGQTGPGLARIWRNRERPIPASPKEIRTLQDHALYYCDPAHSAEFEFLRAGAEAPPAERDVRIAIADLTTPDLQDSPFRVVRAIARGLQPIHYGAGFERALTPQLQARLAGRTPNSAPVPIC